MQTLRRLKKMILRRRKQALARFLDDEESEEEDELDLHLQMKYMSILGKRYLSERKYRKEDKVYWLRFLDTEYTTADEFKEFFRVTRPYFDYIHDKICSHEIILRKKGHAGRDQRDIRLQLMVYLHYLSLSGAGAKFSLVGMLFHLSKGCARRCFYRTLTAILSLLDEYYSWPDNDGREMVSNKFLVTHGFPGCVGCIDGTLFNLHKKPSWMGGDFFTRKSGYAVHGLIVCDSDCRITYICTGMKIILSLYKHFIILYKRLIIIYKHCICL